MLFLFSEVQERSHKQALMLGISLINHLTEVSIAAYVTVIR